MVPVSVPEIQAVQTRAVQPAVAPGGKVHREVDMAAQGLEAGVVEPPDRSHVAGYWPDRQILIAASDGLGNYPFDKKPPNAPAPDTISDHDRFDLAAGTEIKQAGKTDNPAIEFGHPGCHSFSRSEIVVERITVGFYALLPTLGEPEIVHAAVPTDASILELGYGTERILRPLVALGHR